MRNKAVAEARNDCFTPFTEAEEVRDIWPTLLLVSVSKIRIKAKLKGKKKGEKRGVIGKREKERMREKQKKCPGLTGVIKIIPGSFETWPSLVS